MVRLRIAGIAHSQRPVDLDGVVMEHLASNVDSETSVGQMLTYKVARMFDIRRRTRGQAGGVRIIRLEHDIVREAVQQPKILLEPERRVHLPGEHLSRRRRMRKPLKHSSRLPLPVQGVEEKWYV